MTTVDVPAKAGRREWLALALLCLPTMLTTIDINVMFLALPQVSEDLGANSTEQLWITDIYGFLISGFLITMGTLGDRIGRRRLLYLGGVGFIVASLLAAYSTSTEMLIASRALLGIAGATVMPSVLALIRTLFRDPKQMGAAMGLWGTALTVGVVLGPVVGGLLLGAFWWGSIFLMAVPIMALLLIAGPLLLPESRNPDAGRLDVLSMVLSLGGILPVIYGLKELASGGWEPVPAGWILVGLVFLLAFVRRQRRISSPLLDLTLLGNRTLGAGLTFAMFFAFVSGGLGLVATLFMQMVEGLSPFRAGLWMLLPAIAMIIVGNIAPMVARKVRPAYILASGAVLGGVGMVMITQVDAETGLATLVAGLVVVYIGGAPIGALIPFLVMSSAPPEKAGSAGSLPGAVGEFGVALGVAVLGVVGTSVYRSEVDVPAGVPAAAADAARESIAGAVPAASQLGGPAGAELLSSARAAFTEGLNVVAVVTAVLFALLAVLALLGLRHVPPTAAMAMPDGPSPVEEQAPESGVRAAG
ncbi:MFS transporter [Phytohabitans flavus]|nr:MFS transporter [Phytohabitans flavus]